MFSKLTVWLVLSAIMVLLVSGSVFAGDNRINMPPYHFGGDTLYCDENEGCTLLNMHGEFLFNWSQPDISAAFDQLEASNQNTLVGTGTGTYGAASLWAVLTDQTNGNKSLCLQAFDEWGKQNDMCFEVTTDFKYEQAPLPVAASAAAPVPVADCSMWSLGDFVGLIADISKQGPIQSINTAAGTVVFGKYSEYSAACDKIQLVT